MSDLDLIIPVKNQEKQIDGLIKRIDNTLSNANIDYSIIFVDENSTDDTVDKIRFESNNGNSFEKQQIIYSSDGNTNGAKIKIVSKNGKQGKTHSVLQGYRNSKAPFIAVMDDYSQYNPEILPHLLNLAKKDDVILTNCKINKNSIFNGESQKNKFLHIGKDFNDIAVDILSGPTIFKREVIEDLKDSEVDGELFNFYLRKKAKELGYKTSSLLINSPDIKKEQQETKLNDNSFQKLKTKIKSHIYGQSIKIIKGKDNSVIGAGVEFRGKKFITHTNLPLSESALITLTSAQKITFISILVLIAAGFLLNINLTAIILIGILSLIYFIDFLFGLYILIKSLHLPPVIKFKNDELKEVDDRNLPVYSILCPLYKEEKVLPYFIESIEKIDWPKDKLDVILLLEEDDEATQNALKNITVPDHIRVLIVPNSLPKTKPKACNYGLAFAKGKYIVVYDAEDKPDPLQLKKAYITFNKTSKNVVCLQSKLNYYNPEQNLLTKLFTAEYSLWFDLVLPGLQSVETVIPLGGTSNHFRAETLKELHGWDPFNVTEDCDLGTRLFKKGYKTAIIDSTTYEEANSRTRSWLRQRSRWIKGYLQTYLVHMRNPFKFIKTHGIQSFIFQLVIGMRMVFILINPVLWFATFSYFAFNNIVGSYIEALYPAPIFYVAVFCLVFGNFMYLYNYMIGCAQRGYWHLVKYVFLIPLYWLMSSYAAVIAFYQLVTKPYFWEKTEHGLNLSKSRFLWPEIKISLEFDFTLPRLAFDYIKVLVNPWLSIAKNIVDLIDLIYPLPQISFKNSGLNILIFNWRDTKHVWAGGAEVYIQEIAKEWIKKGHNVTLFCGWDGVSKRNEVVDGVGVIRRGGFFTVYLHAFLYYILRLRGKYDVVVDCENGIPFFTPLYISLPKVLLIHHIHQEVFTQHLKFPLSLIAKKLEAGFMPNLYTNIPVVSVSQSTKDDLIKHNWFRKENISVINPGVDFDKFIRSDKTPYPSFIYFGRLKAYKNIDIAIKAFSIILKKYPNAKLSIAGNGESSFYLKNLAKKLGLNDSVTFYGRVDNNIRAELFSSSWAAIQPSSYEGWGITVMEANASGTLVIASDVKGLKDSVVDKRTGILFPLNNVDALVSAMDKIIADKSLRERLSVNSYIYSRNYSWNNSSNNFEELLYRYTDLKIYTDKIFNFS